MSHSKRWIIPPPLTPQADLELAAHPPALRQILFNRGISTREAASSFLRAELTFDTNPFLMKDMDKAVARIRRALESREQIAIYGDYDVDGVTATSLLVQALRALGGSVREYIPNRFDEGYGLNNEALDTLLADGVNLVISVDCGIRSPAEAAHAKSIGLDLIVTDHHEPAGELPQALAVINPKQEGDNYPEKYLAGVGIAYKIVEALYSTFKSTDLELYNLLDLVALGTVADLAPLTGENRHLVRGGLRQMRNSARQGLLSLAAMANISLQKVTAINIGFALGPRLNASGRLDTAIDSYKLLTTSDPAEAGMLAQQLNIQNGQRQQMTRKIQAEAEALALAEDPDPQILFAVADDFNAGVVGLAAARLTETYYRPSIVGHSDPEKGETRCSCRSIPEFHITQALDQCADLLIRHGGHAAAAGFTVRNENLDTLKSRLREIAARELDGKDLRHSLLADAEAPLAEMTSDLLRYLDYLEPTGYGNPGAVFVSRNVRVVNHRAVGADAKHLKLTVSDGKVSFDAIAFRLGEWAGKLPERIDLMYTLETNEYNGRTTLQLNVKDLKPAGLKD
ncbi:MAG: single-stranded-DNA-specific exonuclease RecJ [Chloroflexi bacterium HGW-Chloroflexi-6]|nr:MAG: single-stranded-DNA-specific exonuclease RecJ [Chloroflexi bacterium HGW-Chloroflexi-6]